MWSFTKSCWMLPITAIAVGSLAAPSSAFQVFFGETLNGNGRSPLTSYPAASNAEADFLGNLVGVGTENFEAFRPQQGGPLPIDFGAAGQATLGGSGQIVHVPSGQTNDFGRYGVSGAQFWSANAVGNNFTVNLSQEIAAFGFYGIDLGDFGGQLVLNFTGTSGNHRLTVPHTVGRQGNTDGSVLYFGIIAENETELFNQVSFEMEATLLSLDVFAFDDLTIGSLEQVRPTDLHQGQRNVPEPGSILAAIAAVSGMIWQRRSR